MDILDLLTRSGTYILAVAVFVLTFLTRRIVEGFWPQLKKQADANSPSVTYLTNASRWWNEVILYTIPVGYGAFSAFSTSATLYGGLDGSAKVMFGASVGWFSSFLYKGLKRAIMGKLNLPSTTVISEVTPPVIALKKAYAWVVTHWQWFLLPVGVVLWLLGRGSKQTQVVVASPALTAHEEVDRQLEQAAALRAQAAGVKRDEQLTAAEAQRTEALQATEAGARQQAVDLQNNPDRVSGFLEQVGRDVRRG